MARRGTCQGARVRGFACFTPSRRFRVSLVWVPLNRRRFISYTVPERHVGGHDDDDGCGGTSGGFARATTPRHDECFSVGLDATERGTITLNRTITLFADTPCHMIKNLQNIN